MMYSTLELTSWTIFSSVTIILSIFCFVYTFKKKKQIMNKFKNMSYSKISENIYSLISLNMFIDAFSLLYNLVFVYKVSNNCVDNNDITRHCKVAKVQ